MLPCAFDPASEEVADFIIQYSPSAEKALYTLTGNRCVNQLGNEFAVVHARLSQVEPISIARQTYNAIPKLYGLLDTTALESSGILTVFDQPSLLATGNGVIIGMIDTGIDYTNPLFRLPDGSTRIAAIWDQSIQSETPPEPIRGYQPFYGTVYNENDINLALDAEDPFSVVPSRDTDGHGTFMAGVAAGGRTPSVSFSGAAPDATLAIVKLKPAKQYLRDFFLIPENVAAYQENDIMTAVRFLLAVADQRRMPLVIYLGVGTNQGSHDGTSPLSLQLQALTGFINLATVVPAGNEVGYQHHYLGELSPEQQFQDVELRVGVNEPGFCMELWGASSELYTVGFVSPSGEIVERVPITLGNEEVIQLRLDNTRISLTYQTYESGSGSQLIFIRFETPSPGIWHIRIYPTLSILGRYHIWLPMHGFISDDTVFLRSNPDTTITDPGNGSVPITVSTYNHVNNSIYIHSSRGYTRSLQIKPDLAAPGVDIQGPSLNVTQQNGVPTPTFTRRSGSSVAAAITAGAVADILSWSSAQGNNPPLTISSIKSLLIRGAGRIPAFNYPNRQWGYGTLNLYQSFLYMRE